jgi:hypothetical protein
MIETSAEVAMAVAWVAELFRSDGSGVSEVTLAVFERPAVRPGSTLTTRDRVADPLEARLPSDHVTVPALREPPWSAETNGGPDGIGSVTVTFGAVEGPAFWTCSV